MSRTEHRQSVLNLLRKASVPGSDRLKAYWFIMKRRHTITRQSIAVFYEKGKKKREKDDVLLLTSSVVRWEHNVKSCQRLSSFDRNKSSGRTQWPSLPVWRLYTPAWVSPWTPPPTPVPPPKISKFGGLSLGNWIEKTKRWTGDSTLSKCMNGNVQFIVLGHTRKWHSRNISDASCNRWWHRDYLQVVGCAWFYFSIHCAEHRNWISQKKVFWLIWGANSFCTCQSCLWQNEYEEYIYWGFFSLGRAWARVCSSKVISANAQHRHVKAIKPSRGRRKYDSCQSGTKRRQ